MQDQKPIENSDNSCSMFFIGQNDHCTNFTHDNKENMLSYSSYDLGSSHIVQLENMLTDYVTLTVTYDAVVTSTLDTPADLVSVDTLTQEFNCSYTSSDSIELANGTVYVWNTDSSLNQTNSTNITGTTNTSSLDLTFTEDATYTWNCLATNTENTQEKIHRVDSGNKRY